VPAKPKDGQSQLKRRIATGKEQGHPTYALVDDHMTSDNIDAVLDFEAEKLVGEAGK
jgi:hypothetical protein